MKPKNNVLKLSESVHSDDNNEQQNSTDSQKQGERNDPGAPPTSGLFKQKGGNIYDMEIFYNIFMESCDPTGYTCATSCLTKVPVSKRWQEWKRLLSNPWFARSVSEWQEDLEVKMRSAAIKTIAAGTDSKGFNALKWVAEGRPFREIKVGAPTKVAKAKEERIGRKINTNAFNIISEDD